MMKYRTNPETSVIISFYNKIDYLKLVLAGFVNQSSKNFEIIIADDGSEKKVISELEQHSTSLPFQIRHVWHEDIGFRKNKILNQAVVASNSGYLIFIDGDCVPHKKFIEDHLSLREENKFHTGKRVNLSEKLSSLLTEKKVSDGFLDKNNFKILTDSIFGKTTYAEKGIRIKSSSIRNFITTKNPGILGSNLSLHKNDLLKINGFDERYNQPGIGEDSDLQLRLELAGLTNKPFRNIAIQYHLYHKRLTHPKSNLKILEEVKKEGEYFTKWGIDKSK